MTKSPQVHYLVITKFTAPHALATYVSPLPASHQGYNASKSKAVSSKQASSLTAGVQGNRLQQGNGSQAVYHTTYHSLIA
jgi:hypothetical protein